jgi:mitochondrial-processing peptidase subunit alpha
MQILVHGRKVGAAEMVERIDEVTPETVRKVANRIFGPESGHKATVVCMGKEDVGDWPAVLKKYGIAGA